MLKKNLTEKDLLELIHIYSEKILADLIRIERPLNDTYRDNAQYWLDKRHPDFMEAIQQYQAIQAKKAKPF